MVRFTDIQQRGNPLNPTLLKIRFKGAWDMQELYESLVDWFRDRKWEFHELIYKHKHPSPFGFERQYIWMAEQNVDDWVKVQINLYIHTYDAHDVEVIGKDGVRKIYTQGKIWVVMKIHDYWDPRQRFDTNPLWASLKDFLIKYVVLKRRMLGYSPRYRYELSLLYNFINKKLQMETRDFEYANIVGVHRRGP